MPFSKAAAAPFQTATGWYWSRRRALQSISQDGVCMMGSTCGLVHMKHVVTTICRTQYLVLQYVAVTDAI